MLVFPEQNTYIVIKNAPKRSAFLLTSDPRQSIFMSDAFPTSRSRKRISSPGHSGPTDLAHTCLGVAPWSRNRALDPAGVGGRFSRRSRFAVPCAATAGGKGLAEGRVGGFGKQSQSSFLYPHRQRPRPTCSKN